MMKIYKTLVLMMLLTSALFAQTYTLSGVVTSTESGEKLVGANVYVKGTTMGAATDIDGKFAIPSLQAGEYTVVCSYIGFETIEERVNLSNNMELDFTLKDHQFSLNVTVLADRAKERETPVAFTNIDKKEMEQQLGSRDIPMILNTTPSVYATAQGGGSGDARINIRGFDQKNIAIMINGVPVNDMENGWVYWSNWDGLGDATSSIQVQRGLSAVNLATPSIGGTMNIISDPTALKFGVNFKQELGNDGFLKTTLGANSGKMGKFAASVNLVKKTGNGLIDKNWTDAWAYYMGLSYEINSKNRLELYALGSPQRHGQNLYKQNAATYSHDYARDELGYSQADLDSKREATTGRFYSENWSPVSSSYTGQQYWDGSAQDRYDPEFLNERENYFHKPIVNLNWYSQLSDKLSLYTTAYWSGGQGGGTGTYGSVIWDYASEPTRIVDYNATIDYNDTSSTGSRGILRNSVNNQYTFGLISKAYYKINDNFKTSFGIDWRTAEIDHFREVRDLLGGAYYSYGNDDFASTDQKVLGDKIAYNNTNTVDWFGAYLQGEYSKDRITAYGTFGWSMISYTYTDHFTKEADGSELFSETDFIHGYQVKGGASYRLTTTNSIYANAGYVSKVPIFDQVISDYDGTVASDPTNETFVSFEVGTNNSFLKNKLNAGLNVYYTTWADRANSQSVQNVDGTEDIVNLNGIDARHMGVELELNYKPAPMLKLDGIVSYGNWVYTDDVSGTYIDYSSGGRVDTKYDYYIKDLKVGDQPQTSFVLGATVFPIKGMTFQVLFSMYSNMYANWNVLSRTDATDREQSWQTPSYNLLDVHFNYTLPFNLGGTTFTVFAHAFNLLDTIYIQDAVDNSSYNGISGATSHSAQRAEVFFGTPQSFNAGVSIAFN
ncbi:MAG: TonB-dependent receptor [Melioribacteraceae bacterium]|jgi:iron complex outermembrane receptor protein|nr:TonB-dependent receptor [Melioribacteraceae bacterium]